MVCENYQGKFLFFEQTNSADAFIHWLCFSNRLHFLALFTEIRSVANCLLLFRFYHCVICSQLLAFSDMNNSQLHGLHTTGAGGSFRADIILETKQQQTKQQNKTKHRLCLCMVSTRWSQIIMFMEQRMGQCSCRP